MKSEMIILKVLHEWPLSKVELVKIDGKKFILKTIHKDFIDEINRQKELYKRCKRINISKVYSVKKNDLTVSFLMEYIENNGKKISADVAISIIKSFHHETSNIKNKFFKNYNFNTFYGDFLRVKKYLKSPLNDYNKSKVKLFFESVFNSSYSVVHGDWSHDQILSKNGKYYIVDFGKAYYGPSVLDFYNFDLDKDPLMIKAKLVNIVIELAWLDLCWKKYIDYDYTNKIQEKVEQFSLTEKKLKTFGLV